MLDQLVACDGGTGVMHESFHVDDPTLYSREWFSWANMMFCELVLDTWISAKEHALAQLILGKNHKFTFKTLKFKFRMRFYFMENVVVHIISHSHWDREWYLPFESHRMQLVELFDNSLISLK